MICRECKGRVYVVSSQRLPHGIKRVRRCNNCGVSAYTFETWIAGAPPQTAKDLYTKDEVKKFHNNLVTVRRKNEDRRKDEQA